MVKNMNNIKKCYTKRGYSRTKLSRECGLSTHEIEQLESEKKFADYDTLKKLSKILNVTIDELLGVEKHEVDYEREYDELLQAMTKHYRKILKAYSEDHKVMFTTGIFHVTITENRIG